MLTARIPPPGVFGTVAAPGSQCRQVTADARQASLVSGHLVYRMRVPCLQCFDAVGWAAGRASGL